MKCNFRLIFQKGDIWAIVIVLMIAICSGVVFFPRTEDFENAKVQIWQDGMLVQELSLEENQNVNIEYEYHNLVSIQDKKVCIIESDCPGEDCVHSGWISSVGRSIVCLPNRVEVRIVGVQDDVDFVVR